MNARVVKFVRVPSLVLAGALQVLPIARAALPVAQTATHLLAIVFRWAGAAASALGGVQAVSGASTLITSPLKGTATQGKPFSQRLTTAPDQAHFWTASPLPPGMILWSAAGANPTDWRLLGTNTTSGTFNIRLTAKDKITSGADRTVSSTFVLTVLPGDTAPVISSPPASLTVTEGEQATFGVSVTGTAPFKYQWRKGSAPILGATSSNLVINATSFADAGTYDVIVSNVVSFTTSSGAVLTVKPKPVPPTASISPASLTVTEGDPVTFTAGATGTEPFTYQWRKDAAPILGATAPTLSFPSAALGDKGTYDVIVSNVVSFATSPGSVLTVNPNIPPSVTLAGPVPDGSGFSLTAAGPAGWNITLWSTSDFSTWTAVETKPAPNGTVGFTLAGPLATGGLFYRVTAAP